MTPIIRHARVTPTARIRRMHRMPAGSTPRVLEGQIVKATDTLAVAEVASEHRVVDVADVLNVEPDDAKTYIEKSPGDRVLEGDVLASKRGFLGFGQKTVESPVDGRILRIEEGKILLEGERIRLEVEATVPGRVASIVPDSHIVVETSGTAIQLAWGQGGLSWGALKVMDEIPSLETQPDRFNIDHRGALIVIGSPLTEDFLQAASDIRVKGVLAASVSASLLPMIEELDYPVGVTQGFGKYSMSQSVLDLLHQHNGQEAVLDAGDPSNWRERRAEIIIPLGSQQRASNRDAAANTPLQVGDRVRVLQTPYLGTIGTVASIPADPRRLPSGLWAPGAVVEIEQMAMGRGVFVPFANLERLD